MPTESFEVSALVAASPERVYDAWLSGSEHAAMTGAPATGEPAVGAKFSAWDGYIEGTNLALDPGRRIVQSWRTNEFPVGAPASRLEVILEAAGQGTRITLRHSEIPEGQGEQYRAGWQEHYFDPMGAYFEKPAPRPKKKRRPAKKAAGKKKPARRANRAKRARRRR